MGWYSVGVINDTGVVNAEERHPKDTHAFALGLTHIIKRPKLWALCLGFPSVLGGAEGKHTFLGARFFFIPTRTSEGRIKPMFIKRLFQPFGLPHVRMQCAVIKGVDALFLSLRVLVHDQFHPRVFRGLIAQFIHLLEFPSRIHMHQWKRRGRGIKRLFRQVQHHRAVLANRIQHNWVLGL